MDKIEEIHDKYYKSYPATREEFFDYEEAMKEIVIEFAEWLKKSGYLPYTFSGWTIGIGYDENPITTEQLFDLFNNSK